MKVILIGFTNSGKSTLGQYLARKFKLRFLDCDEVLLNCYPEYKSVREIYRELGAKKFRKAETDALKSLSKNDFDILATGGGSVLDLENLSILKSLGDLVYLRTAAEVLLQRIRHKGLPAFIDPNHVEASFETIYAERDPLYIKSADHQIAMDIVTEDNAADLFKHLLLETAHVE